VPLRASAVFAAIDSATVPLPVPLAPLLIVTHPALLAAVQPHVEAEAVTATDALPPLEPTAWLAGEIENVHGGGGGGAPGCVTVTATPAIVSEPLRSPPVFAAAVNAVDPEPVPEAPAVIVIHGAPLEAVQVQVDAEAVIATLPLPPPVATACVAGDTLNVHGGGGGGGGGGAAPAWFMVNAWPPIVTVPLRATSVFAAAATVTLPLPVPLAPAVTLSQAALAAAVHEHEAALAVTAIVALPPSAVTLALAGEIEKVHDGAGAVCVIVSARPATVTVPERSPPVLAATVKLTVASPVPDVLLSVIHATPLDAVHAHVPCDPLIVTVPLPPAEVNDCVAALTVNVQGGGAPACVSANVCPAIVTVPVRSLVAVFAATVSCTAPVLLPDAPDATVIHGTFEAAVHAQPAPAATVTLVDPPAAATRTLDDDNVNVHGGGDGSGPGFGVGVGGGVGVGAGATPACVTATDCPATRIVADRDATSVFGKARSVADPLADALIAPDAVSHGASLAAVQAHPFSVSMATVTDPPAAGTATFAGVTL